MTTLSGDDTYVNVERLCCRALNPIKKQIKQQLNVQDDLRTAAVCVYPSRVNDCVKAFEKLKSQSVNIASVATGFPSGQYPLETRLKEIQFAIEQSANEIDVVISRSLALDGDWKGVYDEVKEMRKVCDEGNAHLKVIIAAGELDSLSNIYKASICSMLAGADFIKTSTGKETVNATLPIGIIMTRAIWDFHYETGIKVGFKPAGGLKTSQDALNWFELMKRELGNEWLTPNLFRIGASSLLNDIEKTLFQFAFNRVPHHYELSF